MSVLEKSGPMPTRLPSLKVRRPGSADGDRLPAGRVRRSAVSVDIATGDVFRPGRGPLPPDAALQVLIRIHGHPIGAVVLDHDPGQDLLGAARAAAWAELRDEVVRHLRADGVGPDVAPDALAGDVPCHEPLGDLDGPLVTVALATVGNDAGCLRTVRQVLDSPYRHVEVVVVDNGRTAGGLAALLRAEFDPARVRYVHEPRTGLSFARNRGAQEARGEIVVFTDDDVVPDPTWLPAVVRTFARHPQAGCVTGAILPVATETPAQIWLEEYGGYSKGFREEVFDLGDHARDTPLYPYDSGRFGSGANIALRRNDLHLIGPFAIDLGAGTPAHGGEDLDLLRRVVSSGLQLVYQPAALLWHEHPRSYAVLRKKMYRYGVGLSATVAKWCLEDPGTALAIARRLPAGVQHVFGAGSRKNRAKTSAFPKELTRLERIGIAVGPVLYLRSRLVTRARASRLPEAAPAEPERGSSAASH
jgi:GT2 family glycosyltransferase